MGPGFESPEVHQNPACRISLKHGVLHIVIRFAYTSCCRGQYFIGEHSPYSSLAQSVERMTVNHDVAGSSPAGGTKKQAGRKTCFFLSNPKDWYGITRRVYGIRRNATAWHHAPACIFLRIDSIQTYGLIPYRNKLRITYTPLA